MSPRTRVRALVAAGVAFVSAGSDDERPAPGLELGVVLADSPNAQALRAAERAYDRGDRASALRQFEAIRTRDPRSVPAAVGEAIAAWPDGTVDRLRALAVANPRSGVVRLHLGLALFAAGDDQGALAAWRATERVDPDSPAALRAEDLRHPEMPPGRPFFLAPAAGDAAGLEKLSPEAQLAEIERRAEAGGARDWLLYGAVLQRLGRTVSAREAYDRAVALDPNDVEARTAAALVRFDKDRPAEAFSRLGPLAREHPRSAVVRFHLGLALLWLRQAEEAKRQLTLAHEAGPSTPWGREAERVLSRLESIRTS